MAQNERLSSYLTHLSISWQRNKSAIIDGFLMQLQVRVACDWLKQGNDAFQKWDELWDTESTDWKNRTRVKESGIETN